MCFVLSGSRAKMDAADTVFFALGGAIRVAGGPISPRPRNAGPVRSGYMPHGRNLSVQEVHVVMRGMK
jgi:hypothetical protein